MRLRARELEIWIPCHRARQPRFEVCEGWGALPDGWRFVEVAGVATDSHDRVFVFNRGDHPIIVFDREGRFIGSWGEGLFVRPHGITIGPDGTVYCTDDLDHTVKKFTPEGELVADARQERMSLGHGRRPAWTSGRSARPARRSIIRPTWHWPRTARCTSPMDMATLVSIIFARRHSPLLVGRARGRARRVPGAARDRRGARRHGRRGRPREQPPPVLQPRRRVPRGMDRRCAALPGRRRRTRPRVRRGAGLPRGDVAGDDARRPRTRPGDGSASSTRTAGCSPAGAADRTRVPPATSMRRMTSASIRGATSTSAR